MRCPPPSPSKPDSQAWQASGLSISSSLGFRDANEASWTNDMDLGSGGDDED